MQGQAAKKESGFKDTVGSKVMKSTITIGKKFYLEQRQLKVFLRQTLAFNLCIKNIVLKGINITTYKAKIKDVKSLLEQLYKWTT